MTNQTFESILIISKLFFFDKDNNLLNIDFSGFEMFKKQKIMLFIVARNSISLKNKLPDELKDYTLVFERGSDEFKFAIETLKKDRLVSILGVVKEDAIISFNHKIPLFYHEDYEPYNDDKVVDYGLPVSRLMDITNYHNSFVKNPEPYLKHTTNEGDFELISLFNANTYTGPEDEKPIKELFQSNLKAKTPANRDKKILILLLFNLLAMFYRTGLNNEIDIIGTFPSSKPSNTETTVFLLKEKIRTIFNFKPKRGKEILIRHTAVESKHKNYSPHVRKEIKSEYDFNSIIVSPELKDKVRGSTICILDDYVTSGFSAETAKNLLLSLGAKKVYFISFGKFGKEYNSIDYNFTGDLGSPGYKFNEISQVKNYQYSELNFNDNHSNIFEIRDNL